MYSESEIHIDTKRVGVLINSRSYLRKCELGEVATAGGGDQRSNID